MRPSAAASLEVLLDKAGMPNAYVYNFFFGVYNKKHTF